jgi:hypothetical protein
MAIDMDAILGEVKEGIAAATPPAPAAKPAKAAKPATAPKPAAAAAEDEAEEDAAAPDFKGDGGGEVPAPGGKKHLHNFSKAFEKKYGPRPDAEQEEEAT